MVISRVSVEEVITVYHLALRLFIRPVVIFICLRKAGEVLRMTEKNGEVLSRDPIYLDEVKIPLDYIGNLDNCVKLILLLINHSNLVLLVNLITALNRVFFNQLKQGTSITVENNISSHVAINKVNI